MENVESVIFSIEIIDSNKGAWYRQSKGMTFDCVLDYATLGFHGPEICYRVLGNFTSVKHIRIWHGVVKKQRIAQPKELLSKHYEQRK